MKKLMKKIKTLKFTFYFTPKASMFSIIYNHYLKTKTGLLEAMNENINEIIN